MNSPFSPDNLHPKLGEEVEKAYQQNLERGLVMDDPSAGIISNQGLKEILRSRAREAKEKGEIDGVLDFIDNPDIKRNFEKAFLTHEKLFNRIDVQSPSPEKFTQAGINFADLATYYAEMELAGLEPAIVIAPTLDVQSWDSLYRTFNPDKLSINGSLVKDWSSLSKIPDNIAHCQSHYAQPDDPLWTIRLIPGGDKPNQTKVAHLIDNGYHPTVNEYLTLQANRIRLGQPLVDSGPTLTWLNGTIENGKRSPYGVCRGLGNVVTLSGTVSNLCVDYAGTRLPVY